MASPFQLSSSSPTVQLHLPDGRALTGPRGARVGEFLEAVKNDFGAPIVAASAKTGEGLTEVRAALRTLAEAVPARVTDQLPRLPIDRVFTVKGFGTVVTGTLAAGRLLPESRPLHADLDDAHALDLPADVIAGRERRHA